VHHVALPYVQIGTFVNTPRRRERDATSRALGFVILTEAGKDHCVPLSDPGRGSAGTNRKRPGSAIIFL
jgi:hypothetical protein